MNIADSEKSRWRRDFSLSATIIAGGENTISPPARFLSSGEKISLAARNIARVYLLSLAARTFSLPAIKIETFESSARNPAIKMNDNQSGRSMLYIAQFSYASQYVVALVGLHFYSFACSHVCGPHPCEL